MVALATTAHADGASRADDAALGDARRLEANLEYEPALAIVEELIARGGATPAQLVERHLLAGRLAAGLDRADVAKAHFARVLALAPTTSLPAGTSPKLTEPFEAARVIAAPLVVEARAGVAAEIIVKTDTLSLVAGLSARLVDNRVLRGEGTRVEIPRGTWAVEVSALDEHGNVLWSAPVDRAVDSDGGPARAHVPFYRRPTVWLGIGTFTLAVGGLSAWRFQVAQDDWDAQRAAGMTDFTDLQAIEDRGRRWGVVANISFGVTAAAGITAIVCAVVGKPKVVAIHATPSESLLVVGGRF